MRIVGTGFAHAASFFCRLRPLNPGICISAITQEISLRCTDVRQIETVDTPLEASNEWAATDETTDEWR